MVQQNLFSDRHLLTIYTEIFYFGPLRLRDAGVVVHTTTF